MNPNRDKKFDRAVMLYGRGMTLRQLGRLYNCTYQNMHQVLKVRGVQFRPIGPVYKPKPPRLTLEQKFWQRVDRGGADQCWGWKGCIGKNGYGRCWTGDRPEYAHRMAYIYAVGGIPDGMEVIPTCSNRSCCNPAHLKLGTAADRVHKRDASGRNGAYKHAGENHPNTLLTSQQVQRIRSLYSAGRITQAELGTQFGVSYAVIWGIVHRKTWKHIPDQPGE